ncbi:MAG TPA: hypothetical protein PKC96_06865 [Bacilli bacterium]|nr:hypothetical protein [Bacilli bacterium]
MKVDTANFRELSKEFKRLGAIYRIYKTRKKIADKGIERPNFYLAEEKTGDNEENFVALINNLLDEIPTKYALILKSDYFFLDEKNWWQKYYSRATYYRLKLISMKEFLSYIY